MPKKWAPNLEEEEGESYVEFAKGSVSEQNYKLLRRMDRIDSCISNLNIAVQELKQHQYVPLHMVETFVTKNDMKSFEQRYAPIERFFWGVMWSTLGSVGLIVLGLALKAGSGWKW